MPRRSRSARIVARRTARLIARATGLCGSGSASGVITHRSFSTLTGPRANSRELAPDLAQVAAARQLRLARCYRVQPQHAPRLGKLAQDVMVRGWILVPVLREGDDRRVHGSTENGTRRMPRIATDRTDDYPSGTYESSRRRGFMSLRRAFTCCARPSRVRSRSDAGGRAPARGLGHRRLAALDGGRLRVGRSQGRDAWVSSGASEAGAGDAGVAVPAGRGPLVRRRARSREARLDVASTDCGRGPGDYPDTLLPRSVTGDRSGILRDRHPARRRARARKPASSWSATAAHPGRPRDRRRHAAAALAARCGRYYDPRELGWANLGTGTHAAPSTEERACIAMFRELRRDALARSHARAWPARKELLGRLSVRPGDALDRSGRGAVEVKGWIAATQGQRPAPVRDPDRRAAHGRSPGRVSALAKAVREAGGGPTTFLFAVTDEPRAELRRLCRPLHHARSHAATTRIARWTYNGAPPRAGSIVARREAAGHSHVGLARVAWRIPVWYVWDALYWHDRHNRKGAPLPGRAFDPHGRCDVASTTARITATSTACSRCPAIARRRASRRCASPRSAAACRTARCSSSRAPAIRAGTTKLVDALIPKALGDSRRAIGRRGRQARQRGSRRAESCSPSRPANARAEGAIRVRRARARAQAESRSPRSGSCRMRPSRGQLRACAPAVRSSNFGSSRRRATETQIGIGLGLGLGLRPSAWARRRNAYRYDSSQALGRDLQRDEDCVPLVPGLADRRRVRADRVTSRYQPAWLTPVVMPEIAVSAVNPLGAARTYSEDSRRRRTTGGRGRAWSRAGRAAWPGSCMPPPIRWRHRTSASSPDPTTRSPSSSSSSCCSSA